MDEDDQVLDTPNPEEQDDLLAENEPDFMDNEQTWPTEEELAEADGMWQHPIHKWGIDVESFYRAYACHGTWDVRGSSPSYQDQACA